jgi:hypothetical protein
MKSPDIAPVQKQKQSKVRKNVIHTSSTNINQTLLLLSSFIKKYKSSVDKMFPDETLEYYLSLYSNSYEKYEKFINYHLDISNFLNSELSNVYVINEGFVLDHQIDKFYEILERLTKFDCILNQTVITEIDTYEIHLYKHLDFEILVEYSNISGNTMYIKKSQFQTIFNKIV